MKAEEALKILERHPLTRELREQEAARILAQRQEAGARIKELDAEAERTLPALQAEVTEAKEALREHDAARQAHADRLNAARLALSRESGRLDREREAQETILLNTRDPRIDQAREWFTDKIAELRRMTATADTARDGVDLVKLKRKFICRTNAPSIAKACAFCRDAVKLLDALHLEASFDSDAVEALKRGIPDPHVMVEFDKEKPVARDPDPNAGLISDDQMSWELGKLAEWFKRVMGRPW